MRLVAHARTHLGDRREPRRPDPGRARSGLSLIELILALGLFALLSIGLVQLLDTVLSVWEETELEREELGREAALVQWLEQDFEFLAGGESGDLLFDWELFDVNGDGIAARPAPRLRLVRRATAEDLRRLGRRIPVDASGETARPPGTVRPLIEVLWALELPLGVSEKPARGDGVLVRGERLLDGAGTFFDARAFSRDGRVAVSPAEPIAVGVLHWELQFASQTTSLVGGWRPGVDLANSSRAWDARGAQRPDEERHPFNAIAAGNPEYSGSPLLPRRIRIELELERPIDAARRPRLGTVAAVESTELLLTGSRDLPRAGDFVLLGEEWMRVSGVRGERVSVVRGERGTRAVTHPAGSPVQFGARIVRELVVPQHAEDWGL